jgi:hypothetical protein
MGQVSIRATTDRNGLPVKAGTRVRVVAVPESVLDRLEPSERLRVQSMCGETFEVYDVDEWGGAWVEKWWHESDDRSVSHSLGLRPAEMEVAANDV